MEFKIYLCAFFTTVVFMAAVFAEHISDRHLDDLKGEGDYILRGHNIAQSEALLIAVSDPKKILKIKDEVKLGRLDLLKKSRLIIDGVKARLETTLIGDPYGNISMSGESVLQVKNGAVLAVAGGMGARVAERASMEVDSAVFHGQFIGSAKNVVFKNGSLWYISSFSGDDRRAVLEADILVDGSKIISLADISMNDSRKCASKVLTLQKSVWYSNKNKLGISGILRVDDSSIVNVGDFAVGVQGGFASARNEVYLKGAAANSVSRLGAESIAFNSNLLSPRHSEIIQEGNSVVSAGWVRPGGLTSGASRAVWLLANDNNKIDISNDIIWGDNLRGEVHKGYWILTTSSHNGGRKELATNSDLRCRSMRLNASSVENNSLGAKVDWLGNTNSITAKLDVVVGNSTAKNSAALSVLNIGEGARLFVGRHTVIGDENARSGAAFIKISDGASFTHGGHIFLHNSKNADSKSESSLVIECSPIYRKKGIISVGVGSRRGSNALQNAISGNSTLRFKNCGQILYGGGILLAGSSVDLADSGLAHKNAASLFIEDSKLTIDGELYMGHRRFGGGKIYGGSSNVELMGNNSAFISRKKGLRGGFGSAIYGGHRSINMLGKNGTVYFEGDFQMNSAKGARQLGGSFSLNILGEGNRFTAKNIFLGAPNALGGENEIYIKSSNAENANRIFFNDGVLSIRASSKKGSKVFNSVVLDGNAEVSRISDGAADINIGSEFSPVSGVASMSARGENNVIYAGNLNVGSASGGTAVFRAEGYSSFITVTNTLNLRGSGDSYENAKGGAIEFVLDEHGVGSEKGIIETSKVGDFSGKIFVDFSRLIAGFENDTAEFKLICARYDWSETFDSWASGKKLALFKFANEGDSASIVYKNNTMYALLRGAKRENNFAYKSGILFDAAIPEPAALPAILAALSFALAAYKRYGS